jgi:hypothetical protein
MPTGTCRFPEHHGPDAGPPLGFLAAVIAGALIVAEWHAVIIVLAVVAVLAVLGAGVLMLWHSHVSVPYDAAWPEVGIIADTSSSIPAAGLQARVAELELLQLAERRAIEAPQQHLHIHGVSAEDLAAIISRHAIEDGQAENPYHGKDRP